MLTSCYVERGGGCRGKYKRGSGQTSITTNTGTQVLSPQLLRYTCIRPKCKEKQGSLEKERNSPLNCNINCFMFVKA